MSETHQSLSHSNWDCKYHVVFVPKLNLRKRWGIHEPIEDGMPLEKPTLLKEIVNVHMTELGFTAGQMAKLLFYSQQSEFEREFLESGRMRLVG